LAPIFGGVDINHPIPIKTSYEEDAFTRWRRWLIYLEKPGVTKSIKRGYWKRARRTEKLELKNQLDNAIEEFDEFNEE